MSNFVSYDNAEEILQEYADKIKEKDRTFRGTQVEWNALTTAEKAEYDFAAFTDDYDPSSITNPNLLDNPWFTVNQRGKSSYPVKTGSNYCVDRWLYRKDTAVNVNSDNSITVRSDVSGTWILQRLESLDNSKIYTFSVMFGDGSIISATDYFPSSASSNDHVRGNYTLRFQKQESGIYTPVILIPSGVDSIIKAVKLELGSQSTLAMDTIPNYASELLKCQRYFVNYPNSAHPLNLVGVGYETGGIFNLPLPCAMRTTPAITILNTGNMFDANGTALTRTGSFVDAINVNNLRLYLSVSETLPNFRPVTIDQLELSISADL